MFRPSTPIPHSEFPISHSPIANPQLAICNHLTSTLQRPNIMRTAVGPAADRRIDVRPRYLPVGPHVTGEVSGSEFLACFSSLQTLVSSLYPVPMRDTTRKKYLQNEPTCRCGCKIYPHTATPSRKRGQESFSPQGRDPRLRQTSVRKRFLTPFSYAKYAFTTYWCIIR